MPEVWHQTCRLLSPFSSINCSFHCVWFCSKSPGGKSETLPFAVHSWECQVGDLSIAFTALYHTWKRAWNWGLSAETHMKNCTTNSQWVAELWRKLFDFVSRFWICSFYWLISISVIFYKIRSTFACEKCVFTWLLCLAHFSYFLFTIIYIYIYIYIYI